MGRAYRVSWVVCGLAASLVLGGGVGSLQRGEGYFEGGQVLFNGDKSFREKQR